MMFGECFSSQDRATAAAAPCGTAAWVSGPRRNNVPQITAPDAKMAADHQNAVVYPWTRARPISCGPGRPCTKAPGVMWETM